MPELINSAHIEVVSNYETLSKVAARIVLDKLRELPGASLLVPTGTTPEGLYAMLSEQPEDLFEGVTFYNLDEYYTSANGGAFTQLNAEDERSYHYYMKRHLFDAIPAISSFFPGSDNIHSPGSYDTLIEVNGGIDLAINSIGEDGHTFGFNIPGSSLESVTRLIELNENTRAVNAGLTGGVVPTHAVTSGVLTGMKSRQVITLMSGERKANILRQAVWSEVSSDIPATILRTHPNHLFIVDEAAATSL